MNLTLWIFQGILAFLFGMAGIMKTLQPIDKLVKSVNWVERFPLVLVRAIGTCEFLGALGVILPLMLNKVPLLTPLAASGLALIQLAAIFHHAQYKENKAIIFNIVLLCMAFAVAYGRFN